jgi:hypothetical protein
LLYEFDAITHTLDASDFLLWQSMSAATVEVNMAPFIATASRSFAESNDSLTVGMTASQFGQRLFFKLLSVRLCVGWAVCVHPLMCVSQVQT